VPLSGFSGEFLQCSVLTSKSSFVKNKILSKGSRHFRMKLPLGEQKANEMPDSNGESGAEAAAGQNNAPSENGANTAGPAEVDFSEFLWMEHEEEFDEQVMKELEDEEMINYYFELYEASLEEEATTGQHNGAELRVPAPPCQQFRNLPPQNQADHDRVDDLARGFNRLNFASRLNPNAAEFIPRQPTAKSPP